MPNNLKSSVNSSVNTYNCRLSNLIDTDTESIFGEVIADDHRVDKRRCFAKINGRKLVLLCLLIMLITICIHLTVFMLLPRDSRKTSNMMEVSAMPQVVTLSSTPTYSPSNVTFNHPPTTIPTIPKEQLIRGSSYSPSKMPSQQPSHLSLASTSHDLWSSRLFNIIHTITDESTLRNTFSPQYQALTWIKESLSDTDNQSISSSDVLQKYALATMYFSLGGENNQKLGWLSLNEHECSWRGVSCSSDRNVTSITLPNFRLKGTLPSELGVLDRMTYLTLYKNNLTGTVPDTIGNMTMLTKIDLSRNSLSGTIPSSLAKLNRLQKLDLSDNRLSGSLPTSGLGSMLELDRLWLSRNRLTGTLPEEIADMESLADLNLSFNSLTGTLPTVFGEMQGLLSIDLSNNNFTGTVPSEYANLSQLIILRLDENQLIGTTLCPPNLITLNLDSEVRCLTLNAVVTVINNDNHEESSNDNNDTNIDEDM